MKSLVTLLLTCCLSHANLLGQNVNFDWATQLGNSGTAEGFAISVDPQNNIISAGIFHGSVDFDPSPFSSFSIRNPIVTGYNIYIQKLDSRGAFKWAKAFIANAYSFVYDIKSDNQSNIYVAASFLDTIDFTPGIPGNAFYGDGIYDGIIFKLDSNGVFQWAKTTTNQGYLYNTNLEIDQNGNVYVTGLFDDITDFNPTPSTYNLSSNGQYDIFIEKIDSSGNFLWAKSFGGNGSDYVSGLSVDMNSNIYLGGYYSGTADFDPDTGVYNLNSIGPRDLFVIKLNSSGNLTWAKNIGGQLSQTSLSDLKLDYSGNIYATGNFEDSVDFNPGPASNVLVSSGVNNGYILKLSNSGGFEWVKQFEGVGSVSPLSICIDQFNNIYTAGDYLGNIDFDPSQNTQIRTSNTKADIFINKLDSSGQFEWVYAVGGNDTDFCYDIDLDQNSNVYSTGYFTGTVDFNMGNGVNNLVSNNGINSAFQLKLNQSLSTSNNEANVESSLLNVYPNPSSGDFHLINYSNSSIDIKSLKVFSIEGKEIKSSFDFSSSNIKLRFEAPTGIYLLRIQTEKHAETIKLYKVNRSKN